MLGTFTLNLQEISGFSHICPGDEYDLIIRYGQQKWKARGRILKHDKNEQAWTQEKFELKAKLAECVIQGSTVQHPTMGTMYEYDGPFSRA